MSTVESEEPVHQHLTDLFARTAPECVLDVGANAGQYGGLLRRHGYGGWIVSFEPVGSAFDDLAQVADADTHWRALRLALGARAEHRQIAVAEVSQLSSFQPFTDYASAELPLASHVTHFEDVEVKALNDCWEEVLDGIPSSRVFLKLDTQGWDLEVLDGASQRFGQLVGVQLEAAVTPIYEGVPTLARTLELVTAVGFDLTGVFPVNRDSLSRLIEVDCVFINSHHPAAETWRTDTWATLSARFQAEVAGAVPEGSPFVLIDDGTLAMDEIAGRRAIPFLEREGEYYGAPDDGAHAVSELDRMTGNRVRHVAIAWPAFWWLEEYAELTEHLRTRGRRLVDTDAALVFELQ